MKLNFKYIFAALSLAAVFASCDRRAEFQSAKFITLDHYSYSVDETVGEISIPVHIYNQDCHEVQVSVKGVDGTALAGTDFELLSPTSGVLTFPGGTDSLVVKVAIKPHEGVYTGNKSFKVQVASTTDGVVNGNLTTAVVTINDLDHPLSAILGDYTATGLVAIAGGAAQWKVTFAANEESVSKVDVINLSCFDETVVGDVSEDMNVITIPYGQLYEANGYVTMFCGYGIGGYYEDEGNLILTRTETGWKQSSDIDDSEMQWGIGCLATDGEGNPLGWLNYIYPGMVLTDM